MKLQSPERRHIRWRPGRAVPLHPNAEHARTRRSPARRWTAVALVVLAIGVGGIVMSQTRRPAETVFTPEADTYVSAAHPDANYGTKPTLRADAMPKLRSYLRFRLAGLSGRVVQAELRLWSPTGDLVGYSVHPVTNSRWVERGITSRSGPAAGKPVARSRPFGPASWSRVDVARLTEGHEELSLVLTTRSSQNITFDSREGFHKPQLVVRTKPTPTPSQTVSRMATVRFAAHDPYEGFLQLLSA